MANSTVTSTEKPYSAPVQEAVSFHEALAGNWEQKYQKSSFASRQAIVRECLREVRLQGMTWLDAGCGTGTLARWLAEQGCQVEAVDAAPAMLSVAEELTSKSPGPAPVKYRKVTSIDALPFPSNFFDGVLCSSVLEYMHDPSACLEEFSRVLRSPGVLLISVPSARSITRRILKAVHTGTSRFGRAWPKYLSISKHEYSVGEFRELLQAHGFATEGFMCCGNRMAGWFPTNTLVGSLLMFHATK
jgi:2-polyprenyl-6-hydroxyphenyl methylase/3-demethylubiquinone-9 3-methyltransferase